VSHASGSAYGHCAITGLGICSIVAPHGVRASDQLLTIELFRAFWPTNASRQLRIGRSLNMRPRGI
jgi:hypothetical protein